MAIKKFVLDTNVLLHDYHCLKNFSENDVHIPIAVVEELDHFKKGHDQLHFNARKIAHYLDELTNNGDASKGIPLMQEENTGRLFMETHSSLVRIMAEAKLEDIPDHRILATAIDLKGKHPDTEIILVTKDTNLRIKAKVLGIKTEDYKSDQVVDKGVLNKLVTEITLTEDEAEDLSKDKFIRYHRRMKLLPNDSCILRSGEEKTLAHYNPFSQKIEIIENIEARGIRPRNAEQALALHSVLDENIKLIALTGKAGTGKTLLALAAALEQADKYDQILLARPIIALSDKDIGFLPGDAKEKITPYMQPLFDNLQVIKKAHKKFSKEAEQISDYLSSGKLVITPLAYIRGRSLPNVFFIIDEAQNLSPHEVKTIVTRAGEGTKIVFTGDLQQIDAPYLDQHSSGLSHLADKMRGEKIFAQINLIKGERSELAEIGSRLL